MLASHRNSPGFSSLVMGFWPPSPALFMHGCWEYELRPHDCLTSTLPTELVSWAHWMFLIKSFWGSLVWLLFAIILFEFLILFWELVPYWSNRLPFFFFHSTGCVFTLLVLVVVVDFWFNVIPFVSFPFCCLCFWCHTHTHTHTNTHTHMCACVKILYIITHIHSNVLIKIKS